MRRFIHPRSQPALLGVPSPIRTTLRPLRRPILILVHQTFMSYMLVSVCSLPMCLYMCTRQEGGCLQLLRVVFAPFPTKSVCPLTLICALKCELICVAVCSIDALDLIASDWKQVKLRSSLLEVCKCCFSWL